MSLKDKAFNIISYTKNGYIGGYYLEDRGRVEEHSPCYLGGLVVELSDAEAAVEEARKEPCHCACHEAHKHITPTESAELIAEARTNPYYINYAIIRALADALERSERGVARLRKEKSHE